MGALKGHWTVVVLVCFVRTVITAGNLWDTGQMVPHDDDQELTLEETPEVARMLQPHAVPLDYFASKIDAANSFHDVFRIFYGDFLSNDDVETMMTSSNSYLGNQRPRLGGLSHNALPGPHISSIEGTYPIRLHPFQGCSSCYYVPMATVAKETKRSKHLHKHMRRRRRRDKRRRTEEKRKRKRAREISERMRSSGMRGKRATQHALLHVKEIASGAQCHVPLKKVIQVTTSSPELEYFPTCTVMYRCSEDTGCCGETERCVAKFQIPVSRHFYVLRVLHGLQGIPDTPFVHTMTFHNHTECHCQPKPRLPRCLRCPHAVFELSRTENATCVCDCNMRLDITCNRIKRGRTGIHESKLRCIKAGHCHLPTCRFGPFDTTTGYCPQRGLKQHKTKVKPKHKQTESDVVRISSDDDAKVAFGVPITMEEIELRDINLSGKR